MNADQIAAETDLSIEDFIKRGNARDAGEDVPDLEAPAPAEEHQQPVTEQTEPEPQAEPEPEKPSQDAKGKIDGRTREGRKSKIQTEIDAAVEQRRIAREEADRESGRLAQIRADAAAEQRRIEDMRRTAQAPEESELEDDELIRMAMLPDAPQRPRYRTDEAFASALLLFAAEKRIEQKTARVQQERAESERMSAWQGRLADARKANPKFDDDVLAQGRFAMKQSMWDFVIESETGPAVLHYLAKNPNDLQRIATLPTADKITREMARLEARLAAAPSTTGPAPTVVHSSAPAPTKPVGSTPSVGMTDEIADSDDEPVEAHIKRLNKKENRAYPGNHR